ncbi:MAG: S-methyl-5-thioribose-1-phosphate isomerase [Bacteroidota bacterium]|nr:S-methyl-5-thioribose-1-phosphate isomerase [Bacteroidota bacterium]
MKVNDRYYRTVWMEGSVIRYIDQNGLPFRFQIKESRTYRESCAVICGMEVRGAGAIGALAGFAMAQAFLEAPAIDPEIFLLQARREIESTRPTARNLFYATQKVFEAGIKEKANAVKAAFTLADKDAEDSRKIGEYGNDLIHDGCCIETHCNAGWLAFVDYGTALSPVYIAHEQGKKVFVYADETRPRNQGARLTAWELQQAGVPHSIIPDNAGAWFMKLGKIHLVITGADRIAANGDVANKIGTLEKAIAAHEYGIPFYVAAPSSTFDLECKTGEDIPIEERPENEVHYMEGPDEEGILRKIRVTNPFSSAMNPAFDVTPARLITGIITEKGIIHPSATHLANP